ncbi:MAG: tetratricopeptide repeat protein [Treponema sp.]|jgi:tetratricopeptide (TPR) repeat protein|nr:tetratricopeptide repeat protein [Treponema sp.]
MKAGPLFLLFLLIVVYALGAQTSPKPDALQQYRIGREREAQNRLSEANRYYNEAVRICRVEIDQKIATADSYTVFTWALQRLKNYREVIAWGERGLALYPNDYRLNEIMGEAYFYLDDYEKSLASMQRFVNAFANAPRNNDRVSTAYFFIGEIYRLEGKYQRADIAYSVAVRLEPNIALWWYRMGLAREAFGEYALAQEAYQRVLRINPLFTEATAAIARIRQRLNSQSEG